MNGADDKLDGLDTVIRELNEKRKNAATDVNLRCQREQLAILIEKLHKLSCERTDMIGKFPMPELRGTYFSRNNLIISNEINLAQKHRQDVEQMIKTVQTKLQSEKIGI